MDIKGGGLNNTSSKVIRINDQYAYGYWKNTINVCLSIYIFKILVFYYVFIYHMFIICKIMYCNYIHIY